MFSHFIQCFNHFGSQAHTHTHPGEFSKEWIGPNMPTCRIQSTLLIQHLTYFALNFIRLVYGRERMRSIQISTHLGRIVRSVSDQCEWYLRSGTGWCLLRAFSLLLNTLNHVQSDSFENYTSCHFWCCNSLIFELANVARKNYLSKLCTDTDRDIDILWTTI